MRAGSPPRASIARTVRPRVERRRAARRGADGDTPGVAHRVERRRSAGVPLALRSGQRGEVAMAEHLDLAGGGAASSSGRSPGPARGVRCPARRTGRMTCTGGTTRTGGAAGRRTTRRTRVVAAEVIRRRAQGQAPGPVDVLATGDVEMLQGRHGLVHPVRSGGHPGRAQHPREPDERRGEVVGGRAGDCRCRVPPLIRRPPTRRGGPRPGPGPRGTSRKRRGTRSRYPARAATARARRAAERLRPSRGTPRRRAV